MPRLHVNVDHVATVRQARRGTSPDPVAWALRAEAAGAQGITCHLRRDRRHIQDADVERLRREVATLLNLESSLHTEMIAIALRVVPDQLCLVPENRQEVTTEGGLDAIAERPRLADVMPRFREQGVAVSLFLDPDEAQLRMAAELEAQFVELHTGAYANARGDERARELERLVRAAETANSLGLRVNAGHGLDYDNVLPVVDLPHLEEMNIGHSIVARALTDGVGDAVRSMLALLESRP